MRRSVLSRGFTISYRVEGRGAPLLLLHGWAGWADNWWDFGCADELAGEYRVIAIDVLGHGDSDKPHDPANYDGDLVVSDIVAVLDAEQVERALVWGYSMGATNAALLAVREPSRVAALVCGGEAPSPFPEGQGEVLLAVAESVRSAGGFERFMRDGGFADDMVEAFLAVNDTAAVSAVMKVGSTQERADADDVQAPSLWYRGTEDAPFTRKSLDIAARCGVETHLIPGADHVGAFLRADDTLAFVRPFLERHRSSASVG